MKRVGTYGSVVASTSRHDVSTQRPNQKKKRKKRNEEKRKKRKLPHPGGNVEPTACLVRPFLLGQDGPGWISRPGLKRGLDGASMDP